MQLNSDFNDLISALSGAGARFLIVGAYAVIHHSEPRYTKDLDIWVEPTKANARRVMAALRAFGAPVQRISEADLSVPGIIYQIGIEPVRIDLLTSVSGLEFGPAYKNAVPTKYGEAPVRVLSLDDVLSAKRAAGRPQDLIDIARLEEARTERSATTVRLSGKPSKAGSLIIATVSWPFTKAATAIGPSRFISHLQKVGSRCDLVLCAGMTVNDPPMPSEIMEASRHSPVLFERDDRRWCIAFEHDGKALCRVVRERQTVFTAEQFRHKGVYDDGKGNKWEGLRGSNPVATAVAKGEGLIYLEHLDIWFALLICGENNAIRYGSGASVFRDKARNLAVPLEKGRWILLNPAHSPYPHNRHKGFTKVEHFTGRGPMLDKLVRGGWRYGDNTGPPAAVIHCNNFKQGDFSDQKGTWFYASLVFWNGGRRPSKHERGDEQVRIVVYHLPLKHLG